MRQLDPAPAHLSTRETKAAMALRDSVQQNSTMAPFLMLRSSRRLLNLLVVDRWSVGLRSVAHWGPEHLSNTSRDWLASGASGMGSPETFTHCFPSCQGTSVSAHYEKVIPGYCFLYAAISASPEPQGCTLTAAKTRQMPLLQDLLQPGGFKSLAEKA